MLIDPSKKQKFIEKLNRNFRTVLSYGEDKGLVPNGEFIVKDIQEDELPAEYVSKMSEFQFTNLVLAKIEDENVQIVLPMITFLREYSDAATRNADKLAIGSNLNLLLEDIEKVAEEKILNDETLQDLVKAETLTLDESGAEYLINGEVQSSNYSICPVDLGKYIERIREKSNQKENKGRAKKENINYNYYKEELDR